MNKLFTKKFVFFEFLPILITFGCILGFGIYYKQMFIKLLPVCISLCVMLLNSRANRWGFLVGGLNSIIYAVGYALEGLFGTMISALFGAVISFVSFFTWKKRAYGSATVFRRMKPKYEILLCLGFAAAWATASLVLRHMGGTEYILDGFNLPLGIIIPILTMFAFVETLPLNVANVCVSLTLWIRIVAAGNPANVTYLIYSIYGVYMTLRMVKRWIVLYREQHPKTNAEAAR